MLTFLWLDLVAAQKIPGEGQPSEGNSGTSGELAKLLSPVDKEVFQYFNNQTISLAYVLKWFLSCFPHHTVIRFAFQKRKLYF